VAQPEFLIRTGTQDMKVFQEVFSHNVYDLGDPLAGDDVVVDVGANIGAFSAAAISRGAGMVLAYEPEEANYEILRLNLAQAGPRWEAHKRAVWHPDLAPAKLMVHEGARSAMHLLAAEGEVEVETVTLEEILRPLKEVAYLKLDCERGEWPALLLTPGEQLRKCRRITAELHPRLAVAGLRCTVPSAYRALKALGFDVLIDPCGDGYNWMLYAWRE
jgi:FkbM family methyltransferase